MDSNHRMSESKSDALPTWRRGYKLLASRERLELPPRVLETRMLPLHQRDTNLVDRRGIEPRPETCKAPVLPLSLAAQILNTLLRMCVLKNTGGSYEVAPTLLRPPKPHGLQCFLIRYHFFIRTRISHPVGRPFAVLSVAGSRCRCTK